MPEDQFEAALALWQMGLNVLPLHYPDEQHKNDERWAKSPAIEAWKDWQSRKETVTEITRWFLTSGDRNIAVVCGTVSGSLCVIDVDDPKLLHLIIETPIEEMAKTTIVVQTSKGYHIYFRDKQKRRIPTVRIEFDAKTKERIDIQGDNVYVVTAPSMHASGKKYTRISPEGVKIAEVDVYKMLETLTQESIRNGASVSRKFADTEEKEKHEPVVDIPENRIREILEEHVGREKMMLYKYTGEHTLQGPHPAHGSVTGSNFTVNMRNGEWYCFRHNTGGGVLRLVGILSGKLECTPAVMDNPLDEATKDLLFTFAKGRGMKKKDDSLKCHENHDSVRYVPVTRFESGDCIYEQTNPGFVKWNVNTGHYEIVPHHHTGKMIEEKKKGKKKGDAEEVEKLEIVYTPMRTDSLRYGQLILADEPEPCKSLAALIREIEEKAARWLFVGEEEMPIFRVQLRVAVASWFLYVFDDPRIQERIAGLVGVVGVSGGGKKRFLTILKMIAYRPFYTLNTSKIPSVYRLLEPWHTPTLLVDEADQKDTGSEAEWVQFINGRYDGTPIPRYNASTQKNELFRSFGLTAIALRRMPRDEGITSRMVKINATISPVDLPEIAGLDIYDEFRTIRNKLLYLRLKYHGTMKFIGSSGLKAEYSWRGKETLTLYRLLAQIDEVIDKDIDEIAKALTLREVENLSATFDGLIINEVFDFIASDQAGWIKRAGGIYFVHNYKNEDGKEYSTPLTLSTIAAALNSFATDIQRSMVQLKIDTFDRMKVGNMKRQYKGVLYFRHLADTDRIFQRYILNYDHTLLKISGEIDGKKIEHFDGEKPENGDETRKNGEKGGQELPSLPSLPPSSTPMSTGNCIIFSEKKESTSDQRTDMAYTSNVPPHTLLGGKLGKLGNFPAQSLTESVMIWVVKHLKGATGDNMEQTAGGLYMRVSEEYEKEGKPGNNQPMNIYVMKDALELGKSRGLLRERGGRWSAV